MTDTGAGRNPDGVPPDLPDDLLDDPADEGLELEPVGEGDGRHRRRDRNRETVVDAVLSLFREHNVQPSAAEIAERAGLSQRSLFRYFTDLDDLSRLAISRQLQLVTHLAPIGAAADAPLAERVRALAAQRVALFDEAAPAARVTRFRAPLQVLVREQLDRGRQFLRRQIADLVAPELAGLDPQVAADLLDTLDVLASFEVHQLLRESRGRSSDDTVALLASVLLAQLTAVGL